MERSASSLYAANNTLDESIALITAANTVVQNPEAVGTAFKTISMRIRGAKTELEEAGLETDGMVESTAKLREEILALSGVDIMEDANTFKSTYQIMDELATKWKDLTDIQQASITELIAGKRQGNIVSSLMTNFDVARDALNTSLESSGSAMVEHGKWSDSLEARLNKLKATWQSFAQSFLNSDGLKGGIDALRVLVGLLDGLVKNFGTLGTIALGVIGKGIHSGIKEIRESAKASAENAVAKAAEAEATEMSAAAKVADTEATRTSTAAEVAEAEANTVNSSSETAEANANVASATSEAGEAAANMTSAASEVAEADANAASAASELVESEANAASAASELSENEANLVSAATEAAEATANTASAATEAAEATASLSSAAAEAGESAIKASGGFAKFFGTLGGKIAIIAAVVAAIGLLYNQYKKAKEAAAEARQEIITESDEYLGAVKSFEQAYIKYSGRTDLTVDEESELESAIQGTVNALGNKHSALQNVVNSSNDYVTSLEQIANAEKIAANNAAKRKLIAAEKDLEEVAIGWQKFDGSEVNIGFSSSANEEAIAIAKEIGSEFWEEVSTGRFQKIQVGFKLDANADSDEILEYYYMLIEYQKQLEDAELTDTNEYDNITAAIGKMSEAVGVYTTGVYEAAKAQYQLSNGIPKTVEEYIKMRESILSDMSDMSLDTRKSIASSLDSEYRKYFDLSSAEIQARKLIGVLDEYGDTEAAQIETFLNMRTAVNGDECPVGKYMSQFDKINEMTEGWSEEAINELNMAFGIDTDKIKTQYDDVKKYLLRQVGTDEQKSAFNRIGYSLSDEERSALQGYYKDLDIYEERIENFLDGLTASELQAVIDIRTEIDWKNASDEDIRKQIEERVKINEALNFNANIEVDTASLETLNTALSESASAIGLTTESIDSLKSKYSDLEGYDPATLFEATANGVKVNREELAKLEKEYNNLTKSEVDEHISTLVDEYNDLTKEILACNDETERAELLAERDAYSNKIEELAQYQAQLEGVTGAYQRWLDAQEAPESYEGYEAIAKSREEIKDEIKRGLLGNASKEYIDLLSGEDLRGGNIDDYAAAWDRLDDKITSTGYSINDFFTLNDDGEVTATGIHRFFKSVETEFEGSVYKLNEKTGEWYYDFSAENIKLIQDTWGMGADAIGLMLEAAVAAGYNVDWGGILDNIDLGISDLETLVSTAEAAQKTFNDITGLDVDFNFEVTSVKDATSELEEARAIYNDLITNDNGVVNLNAEGAEEMRFMLSTILIQKQQLEDSNIAINIDTSKLDDSQADIAAAIDAVSNFREKYKNLEIAVTTGKGVSEAKTELNEALVELQGLGDEGIDIAAQLILGEGSSGEALKAEVDNALAVVGADAKVAVGLKLDETSLGGLNSQLLTNFTPEATVKITGIDDSLVGEYESTTKTANGEVKWTNDDSLVVEFQETNHIANGTVYWDDNTVNLKTTYTGNGIIYWNAAEANGTANVNGTAKSGRAFARGDWGIKGNGTALVGELGMETLVRDGHFYTIGDSGAEFIKYRQGDIIFNHKQTEELFKNGRVTSDGGRGKMFANGSAYANGSYPSSGRAFYDATAREYGFAQRSASSASKSMKVDAEEVKLDADKVTGAGAAATGSDFADKNSDTSGNKSGSGGGGGGSSKSEKDEFEEVIDWIEIAISRIEREIDNLDQKANNIYKNWSERNGALVDEISKVGDEIELQSEAYDRYMQEANSIGLSSDWAEKVRNGEVDIETITDESLKEKIDEYQQWYEKALDCQDAIEELKEKESELYQQRFENVSTQYEGVLGVIEHEKNMLDEYINQSETQGGLVSYEYYRALSSNEKKNIAELEKQKADMLAQLQVAMESGTIEKGSEAWYEMVSAIDDVSLSLEEANTRVMEISQTAQQLKWEQFDLLQDKISSITEEAEFLIELLSSNKLYDDNGQLTNSGMATMGLHGQNYNTYMYQAEQARIEAERIKAEMESGLYGGTDKYDTELEERYREMISLQQEHILAAQGEKEAIRDMVEEGIQLELDALQERIDKYNEALDSQKDLFEHQKKVKEQTEEIASLEKQMAAYSGDDSEEAKQKIQQIKVDLESAKEDLQETEYDRYISDQQQMLDELYLEYEEVLNTRLDNIDALIEDMVEQVNANANDISATLIEVTDSVSYTMSESMDSIWNASTVSINGAIATYGDKFASLQTNTNIALGNIKNDLDAMITQLNTIANTNVESANESSAFNSEQANATEKPDETPTITPTQTPTEDNTEKTIEVGGKINAGSAKIYDYAGDTSGERQYFRNDPIYTVLQEKNGYLLVRHHKLKSGATGWFKKSDVKAYATGKKDFLGDEIAWTQDGGREFIVRPSDGAILTPVAKGDSVLNTTASNNIWNMANSPAEFIKDNLKLGATNVPNSSTVQSNCVQNFENVTFSMPNVHSYSELLAEMQRDKNFEKLILSMSIDRIAGKSGLAKGKSIR